MSGSTSGYTNNTTDKTQHPGAAINNIGHSNNNNTNIRSNNNNNISDFSTIAKPSTHTTNMMKEPKTPSLNKSTPTFSSPAPAVELPETPDRIPRQINADLDSTPLLSPVPSTNIFATPGKRKGSISHDAPDFYTLLKSPEVRMDDKNLKRTSLELFGNYKKSPERVNKEYDSDHLLKSPRRNVNEIKKISENLKTRLNYANFKVQHGLSRKSIGELEQSLDTIANGGSKTEPKNLDDFWNLRADNLPANTGTEGTMLLASPGSFAKSATATKRRTSFNIPINLDDIARRGVKASPDSVSGEFSPVKSISIPHTSSSLSSLTQPASLNSSKLGNPNTLSVNTKGGVSDRKLEQDAIYSLISMSSPTKYTAGSSISPSPPKQYALPTSTSLKLSPPNLSASSNLTQRLPPLSAPGVLGGSASLDNPINRYVFPPPSQGLGMFTASDINPRGSRTTIDSKMELAKKVDDDLTEDETTEEEIIDDKEAVATDRVNFESLQSTQTRSTVVDSKFRTIKYDNLKNKMTFQKNVGKK